MIRFIPALCLFSLAAVQVIPVYEVGIAGNWILASLLAFTGIPLAVYVGVAMLIEELKERKS